MKKATRFIAMALILVTSLAGCQSLGPSSETASEASSETTVASQEQASEASTGESVEHAMDAAWPRTFTDAAGKTVVLEKAPERIALLHSFYLEHFLALGTPPAACAFGNAGGQREPLSGSELFAPYMADLSIIDLGAAREINLEAILKSNPDVIVTFAGQGGVDTVYDQLSQIAPVVLLDYKAPWSDQLKDCARVVGREAEAEAAIADIEDALSKARETLSDFKERSFALFRTDGKGFTTRALPAYYETFGITPPTGWPEAYETLSLETVSEMNPYYIVFQHNAEASHAFVESLKDSKVWQSMDAVKNGRIFYFDEHMNAFGPLAHDLTARKLVALYTGTPLEK